MKVSGTKIAQKILLNLKDTIDKYSINPNLGIVLATNNPAPYIYVNLKTKRAEEIGVNITKYELNQTEEGRANQIVNVLNNDSTTHGILIQLPTYQSWNSSQLVNAVNPHKDVDGFVENSDFKPATGLAVWEMLTEFASIEGFASTSDFLQNKKIAILGKGKTAGKPTADLLRAFGFNPTVIDSKTNDPQTITIQSDIIISATGRKNIINRHNIKENVYIIGVGVGKEETETGDQIFGDIDEESIKDKAKLYCPTIGGIGPLTIACLLRNTVQSALNQQKIDIRL